MNRVPPREHLRAAYAELLARTGSLGRATRSLRQRALVLMYHRVLNDAAVPDDIDPGMYVTHSTFERHLEHLSANHDVVGFDAFRRWLLGETTFPRIPCVITFDDGWADNYTEAFPLLRRYGLPATIFLATGLVGTTSMLTWDQVREMEAEGIDFGSHTVTHPVLTTIDDERIRVELMCSKDRLQAELDHPIEWFCYPKGAYDSRSLAVARSTYVGAVSTEEGPVNVNDDPHRVHRIGIHNDVTRTTALFACRLTSLL
jgi:peptidoglycan/xylan/chitin deacetylase (PgdA/CDA1 family)